jgi:hypothetical protein
MPKDHRSAENGRFVKESYAKSHKDTTVSEERGSSRSSSTSRREARPTSPSSRSPASPPTSPPGGS